ncbi:hypothetical protein F4780DRAFT_490021 [Xylariomycetidae sp. FL0641]|nr:hypothetical protein F4780DRAFT_490021 [Xylariomycetidae sp. FL0641]
MALSIEGPDGPIPLEFGEATDAQRIQCHKLGFREFGWQLSEADYIAREEFLGTLPLTRNSGWRFWAVRTTSTAVADPSQAVVVAACKTIHRDLYVRDDDAAGPRWGQGYCIASVVTHPAHRGRGLAAFLLKELARWLDGPGHAVASTLYSGVGNFYVDKGWKPLPAPQCVLTLASPGSGAGKQQQVRLLGADDVAPLCARDVAELKAGLAAGEAPAPGGEVRTTTTTTRVAVLPTADLVGWLHARAAFIANAQARGGGQVPGVYGAADDAAGAWVYWYHDFQKRKLSVQRVHLPSSSSSGTPGSTAAASSAAVGRLFAAALAEARTWGLDGGVHVWSPCPRTRRAIQVLAETTPGVEAVFGERELLPCIRWARDEDRQLVVDPYEFYAWH